MTCIWNNIFIATWLLHRLVFYLFLLFLQFVYARNHIFRENGSETMNLVFLCENGIPKSSKFRCKSALWMWTGINIVTLFCIFLLCVRFTREEVSAMYRAWVLPTWAKMVLKEIRHGGTLAKDTWHWHSVAARYADRGYSRGMLQQMWASKVTKAFHGPQDKVPQKLAITHMEAKDKSHVEVPLHSCWTPTWQRGKFCGHIYWLGDGHLQLEKARTDGDAKE